MVEKKHEEEPKTLNTDNISPDTVILLASEPDFNICQYASLLNDILSWLRNLGASKNAVLVKLRHCFHNKLIVCAHGCRE